jgi:hypothetical protein
MVGKNPGKKARARQKMVRRCVPATSCKYLAIFLEFSPQQLPKMPLYAIVQYSMSPFGSGLALGGVTVIEDIKMIIKIFHF